MSQFEEKLEEYIEELKPELKGQVDFTKSPEQLGFDSLDYVELEMCIDDDYGVEFHDTSRYFNKPLSELAHYLESEVNLQHGG